MQNLSHKIVVCMSLFLFTQLYTRAPEAVTELTSMAEYKQALKDNKFVVIDLFAHWCGACKLYGPAFDSVAEKYKNQAAFFRLNIDTKSLDSIGRTYATEGIPATLFIKDGEVADTVTGSISEHLLDTKVKMLLGSNGSQIVHRQEKIGDAPQKKTTKKISKPQPKAKPSAEPVVKEIRSEAGFDRALEASHKKPVIIKFTGDFCSACQMMAPHYKNVAKKYKDQVHFLEINVANPNLQAISDEYAEQGIPTTIFIKNGVVDDNKTQVGGLSEEDFETFVQDFLTPKTKKSHKSYKKRR